MTEKIEKRTEIQQIAAVIGGGVIGGGSRRLCGASREPWEGCRWFGKGSGRKVLIYHRFSEVCGGNQRLARTVAQLGWDPQIDNFQRKQ